jgi:3-oxoacyl-[acyl-carrier protein] reductase
MSERQQVALISGSTRGIGKAIAEQLVLDGYIVVQNSRALVQDVELVGQTHIRADVTNPNECKELIKKIVEMYGQLNLLVCNVGSGKNLSSEVGPTELWNHFLNINLSSTTYLVDSALEALIATKGNTVAISSICGEDPTIEAPIGYTTAKAGLEMFMKTMAVRYGNKGLRFNVVSPGNVLFEGSVWDQKLKADKVGVNSYLEQQVPLARFITPQEIARAVSFLASSGAQSITGIVLPIDGGQSL